MLYSKDYKTVMKETEDNTNIWKDVKCSWIGKINIVQMTVLHKTVTDSMQSYRNTKGIFHKTRNNNFKICMETQKTTNIQNNIEKEEQTWRNHVSSLQSITQSYSHLNSMVLVQQ